MKNLYRRLSAALMLVLLPAVSSFASQNQNPNVKAVTDSLSKSMQAVQDIITSGWTTTFLAVILISLLVAYVVNRQDEEMKQNLLRYIVACAGITGAQSIAMVFFPTSTGALLGF